MGVIVVGRGAVIIAPAPQRGVVVAVGAGLRGTKGNPGDIGPEGGVSSVNGATGVVVLDAASVGAATAAQGGKADSAVQPGALTALVADLLAAKVDKAPGKDLSSNDYTSGEKAKLAGVAAEATANPNTDSLGEGAANLYHTPLRVLATKLMGISTISSGPVTGDDSILSAIGKLVARVAAIEASGGAGVFPANALADASGAVLVDGAGQTLTYGTLQ